METGWLKRLLCGHKIWLALDPATHELDDHSVSITWQRMACQHCGKIRHENILKAGEQVIIDWMP